MKRVVIGFLVLMMSSTAFAAEYMYMKCADLTSLPGASSHLIGWLDLRNPGKTSEIIDFRQGLADETALERTCQNNPQLPLYMAVMLTFPQIDFEGHHSPSEQDASSDSPRLHHRLAD